MNRHTTADVCHETRINSPVLKCEWMFKDCKEQGLLSHLRGNTSNAK